MHFKFSTAPRIIFGPGKLQEVGSLAQSLGRRPLVVIGKSAGAARRAEPLLTQLSASATFSVAGEPTFDAVRAGIQCCRDEQCDGVISFGGGSVIDAGKGIAMLLANGGDPLDYAEVIGRGRPVTKPSAPFIAIPTTAGTGAEVTRNAVVGSPEHHVKVSLRSPLMLPAVALVDPNVVRVTVATGLDALTQLIEPFVSCRANPMTDALCREGMQRVARSLRRAVESQDDTAREDMALAAMFSGIALANAGLGAVHGLAGPLGGMYGAPHGALCAALLPSVFHMNAQVVRNHERFDEVQHIVGDVAGLCRDLGVKPLREHGVRRMEFDAIVEKAQAARSMKANPVSLTAEQLREILERAW